MNDKLPEAPKLSPTRDGHFARIEATPEQLAKAILRMPRKDWDYMKDEPADE